MEVLEPGPVPLLDSAAGDLGHAELLSEQLRVLESEADVHMMQPVSPCEPQWTSGLTAQEGHDGA